MKWSECGDLLEVKSENDSNRWRRCVVEWTVFRMLNTSPGVVGGQRTFDSRPAVLPPFIACRTVPALVLLCRLSFLLYSPICVHLLNCHFHIILIIPLTTRQSTIATKLVLQTKKVNGCTYILSIYQSINCICQLVDCVQFTRITFIDLYYVETFCRPVVMQM